VIGKPAPPEGPLNVADVYEDHCTLDWKPPLDDGGLNIDHVGRELNVKKNHISFHQFSMKWRKWTKQQDGGCRAADRRAQK
jgi:hypothetical protein